MSSSYELQVDAIAAMTDFFSSHGRPGKKDVNCVDLDAEDEVTTLFSFAGVSNVNRTQRKRNRQTKRAPFNRRRGSSVLSSSTGQST